MGLQWDMEMWPGSVYTHGQDRSEVSSDLLLTFEPELLSTKNSRQGASTPRLVPLGHIDTLLPLLLLMVPGRMWEPTIPLSSEHRARTHPTRNITPDVRVHRPSVFRFHTGTLD